MNATAAAATDTLRLSMDVKARVKVGPFARGGTNRVPTAGADHDFGVVAQGAPIGILVPQTAEVFLYTTTGPVTSDCLVDVLERRWAQGQGQGPGVRRLVLNLDNGPENHSGRTQFMKRLVEFAARQGLTIELAYYPPYHSKYNPIERCWAALEQHWNGSILDTAAAKKAGGVIGMARDSSSTDPVILPPQWGRRRMEVPFAGYEWCYGCDGDGTCWICQGERYVEGALCTECNGSGRCILCRGAGQLALGSRAHDLRREAEFTS